MSDQRIEHLRRRTVLAGAGSALVGGVLLTGTAGASGHGDEVTVTLDNVGASAWEVTALDGEESVADIGVENPTLTLREGVRYTVENGGWSFHPLELFDADGEALLSQDGSGSFEDDPAVDWVDSGETLSFTVTEALAAELDGYICTVHPSMEGVVETTAGSDAPAAVEFPDQSTLGTSVVVDSVRMDDGGFVTIHDSRLLEGQPLESVIGVSGLLEPGTTEAVEIPLADPIAADETLVAMPHRDTDGDGTYSFVESGGETDGPYTFDGGAVTDDATVQVDGGAAVAISDQESNGTAVLTDFLRIDDGGFLTIHDSRLLDGQPLESVVGVSEALEPGVYEDIEVTLEDPLATEETLIPMPHRDDPADQEYSFVESGGDEDPPYLDLDGNPVTDEATVTPDLVAELSFPTQATASSTITADSPTTPAVVVEGVTADVESAVVVTHEADGDLVVSGVDTFGADELAETDVTIPVEDDGGFPGEHVAHLLPHESLSGSYAPGDTVSAETADAVLTSDTATVVQASIDFADQSSPEPVVSGEPLGTVDAAVQAGDTDLAYTVDVHPTDEDGSLVGPQYVASSDVLSGEQTGAELLAERVPADGDANQLPSEGTDTFVAMIHLAEGDSPGDASAPGSGPVLAHAGAGGFVPGGVTDSAAVTVEATPDGMDDEKEDGTDDGMNDGMDDETEGGTDDGMNDGMDDGTDDGMSDGTDDGMSDGTDSATNESEDEDGSGPGFGPIAGVAGLGGAAAYLYRRAGGVSDPATDEDES